MDNFPSTLEQQLNEQGFQYIPGSTSITSDVDVGVPKKRRRYTKPFNSFTGSFLLKKDQFDTLENFYQTTLAGGTLPFFYTHPIKGTQTVMQFQTEYSVASLGGLYFTVSIQFWELPQ